MQTATSIRDLLSDPRLTDAIDDDPRNHFRTPIFGTTRLARRAAAQMYWVVVSQPLDPSLREMMTANGLGSLGRKDRTGDPDRDMREDKLPKMATKRIPKPRLLLPKGRMEEGRGKKEARTRRPGAARELRFLRNIRGEGDWALMYNAYMASGCVPLP